MIKTKSIQLRFNLIKQYGMENNNKLGNLFKLIKD